MEYLKASFPRLLWGHRGENYGNTEKRNYKLKIVKQMSYSQICHNPKALQSMAVSLISPHQVTFGMKWMYISGFGVIVTDGLAVMRPVCESTHIIISIISNSNGLDHPPPAAWGWCTAKLPSPARSLPEFSSSRPLSAPPSGLWTNLHQVASWVLYSLPRPAETWRSSGSTTLDTNTSYVASTTPTSLRLRHNLCSCCVEDI